MVEVFDIQRNFKEKTEIVKKKYKEGKGTKGVATIQLFDEGTLVQETISNNFITNPIEKKHLYAYLSNELGLKQNSQYSYYNRLISLGGERRFGQIQLRSGDFEEDENERIIKGELVGCCLRDSTDAGSDKLKGTYNASESFMKQEANGYYHCHLVYDFSTSQANGTFNHIYWNYNNTSSTINASIINVVDTPYWYRSSYGVKGSIHLSATGEYFVKSSDLYYKLKNKDLLLSGIQTNPEYDLNDPVKYVPSYKKVGEDNYVEISCESNGGLNPSDRKCITTISLYNKNHELIKEKKLDILSLDGVKRMNEAMKSNSSNPSYITASSLRFVGYDGKVFFACFAYDRTGTATLPQFKDGVLVDKAVSNQSYLLCYDIINEAWVYNPNPYEEIKTSYETFFPHSSYYNNYYLGDNKYLYLKNGYVYMIDIDNFTTKSVVTSGTNNSYDQGADFRKGILLGKSTSNGEYTQIHNIIPYTAHTKLPNPVTKTNKTTMKITYDYYIQLPNLFCETEGEEFTWK